MSFFTTKHKTASLIMAALMSISVAGTALADDLEEQLQDLQEKAAQQQEITNEAQARVENLSEKLRVLQEEVDAATSEYNDVKGRLDKVQSDIYENTELLNKTEKELKVKNKKLAKRVRDIYINGQISYVDVLFGAKDFSDFLTRMDILKRIIKHDYDLIMKVKADREIVMNTKAKLEKDKADVELLVADAEIKQKNMLDKNIKAVGVFVDEDFDNVVSLLSAGTIDIAQLHGNESEDYIIRLKAITGRPVIKAFRIKTKDDINAANESPADMILTDAGAGDGRVFDWSLLNTLTRPYFLAGGLDVSNISDVKLNPYLFALDVSSGIETNGYKDKKKMAAFMDAVRKEEIS